MHIRELSVGVAFVAVLGLLAVVAPTFFRPEHLKDKLVANAPVLIAAVGMTLVMLSRQIDISIGSQFSVCGIVAALLAENDCSLFVVVAGSVACGAAMGLVNGFFVACLKLPAIVVTLATMVIWREALRWGREGEFVRNLQDKLQWFGNGQTFGQWTIVAVAGLVLIVAAWCLWSTQVGRTVYAVGSNQEAARLMGVRPTLVLLSVFVVMGMLTGLAALLNATRFGDVDPNAGTGLELQVIAAVVIGGTAVSGGRGTLMGTLLGVALLGIIGPALVFLKTEPQWEKALQGLIILAAVACEAWPQRMSSHVTTIRDKPAAKPI
jgi:rhamnose transport system permease protein